MESGASKCVRTQGVIFPQKAEVYFSKIRKMCQADFEAFDKEYEKRLECLPERS